MLTFEGKTIFVAPLDWGLGHASRCVALIKKLRPHNQVIIGTTPVTQEVFTAYFPELEQVQLPSYNIRYSRYLPQWLYTLLRVPGIMATIRAEKKFTRRLVSEKKIDVLISDNRYGVFNARTPSYFICHQLNILAPLFPRVLSALHQSFLKKFTGVWVPDFPDHRLSGKLSVTSRIKFECIGPLSALPAGVETSRTSIKFLALLSGPEPQRSTLETLLLEILGEINGDHVLVRGTNQPRAGRVPGNVSTHDLVTGDLLRSLIINADTVICRGGYSTLMDLHVLEKKKIILIPTPGQPEQEYLASHWQRRFSATVIRQKDLRSKSTIGRMLTTSLSR